jgi:hypothetical protein
MLCCNYELKKKKSPGVVWWFFFTNNDTLPLNWVALGCGNKKYDHYQWYTPAV